MHSELIALCDSRVISKQKLLVDSCDCAPCRTSGELGNFLDEVFYFLLAAPSLVMVLQRISPFNTQNDGLADAPNLDHTAWARAQKVFLVVFWVGLNHLILIPISLVYLLQAINNFKQGSPGGGMVYLLHIVTYPATYTMFLSFFPTFYYHCVS